MVAPQRFTDAVLKILYPLHHPHAILQEPELMLPSSNNLYHQSTSITVIINHSLYRLIFTIIIMLMIIDNDDIWCWWSLIIDHWLMLIIDNDNLNGFFVSSQVATGAARSLKSDGYMTYIVLFFPLKEYIGSMKTTNQHCFFPKTKL